ncbi:MAG: prepilin-type N-terminal cleavage/methylation domain-containing protein [Rickettsiales bacterium]|nr:prepilin-type N-terminal cleavage/methylation domain-containing protein [Rickettsiales bacterium]
MKKHSAFSLVELSIVIVIIAILIVGITQGRGIISKSKIGAAQNQTAQSPIAETENLIAWWETSSEKSFDKSENDDDQTISTWFDINPKSLAAINMTQTNAANKPTYKLDIWNGLPMLKFTSGNNYFNIADGTVPYQNSNYTVFIVGKFGSCGGTCNILASGTVGLGLNSFQYNSNSIINNWNSSSLSANAAIKDFHIYSFLYSNASGRTIFIDGNQGANDSTTNRNSSSGANYLGSIVASTGLDGYLGEVIIFNRNLRLEERKAIEKYLSRKWAIAVQ